LLSSGRERRRQKDKSTISKLSQKRTPSAPPLAPPPAPKPAPPPPPPPPPPPSLPPPRARGGQRSKQPKRASLPSRQVLDVDGVCVEDTRRRDGGMNSSVQKQTGDMRNRRVRIRRGAWQMSGQLPNKPLPVKATEPANTPPSSESKHKATFV
ncbi:protein VASP homolog, partial [Tachysurus fulvidraco]|uniref:protein VASP homolog n=1 Tax=Tachysurus fulvidraco TaxID=1234273 RepID=UPI001FED9F81